MWTRDDLAWLAKSYPRLREIKPGLIEGNLRFKMLRTGGEHLVNPPENLVQDTSPTDYLYIDDSYKILITWSSGESQPKAYEIGGKLDKVANQLDKNLLDMHRYGQDGALCLAASMDIERAFRDSFKLDVFVEEFLIPYLFAQSHYAKTQQWLWGELSHGYLGLLEWLGRQKEYDDRDIGATYKWLMGYGDKAKVEELLKTRCRGHHPCPCGSNKKTRDCHPDVQQAISLLRGALSRGLALVPK
jgi:hypothetical protein